MCFCSTHLLRRLHGLGRRRQVDPQPVRHSVHRLHRARRQVTTWRQLTSIQLKYLARRSSSYTPYYNHAAQTIICPLNFFTVRCLKKWERSTHQSKSRHPTVECFAGRCPAVTTWLCTWRTRTRYVTKSAGLRFVIDWLDEREPYKSILFIVLIR